MEKRVKILIIAGIFLVITLLLGIYYNSSQIYAAPIEIIEDLEKTDGKAFYSSNWAGYVAVKKDANNITLTNTVKYVKGSWTVPEVDCTSTPNGLTFVWVGIDGYGSSTIEQIGTSSKCVNSNAENFIQVLLFLFLHFQLVQEIILQQKLNICRKKINSG